jgi:hypothetical protein
MSGSRRAASPAARLKEAVSEFHRVTALIDWMNETLYPPDEPDNFRRNLNGALDRWWCLLRAITALPAAAHDSG